MPATAMLITSQGNPWDTAAETEPTANTSRATSKTSR